MSNYLYYSINYSNLLLNFINFFEDKNNENLENLLMIYQEEILKQKNQIIENNNEMKLELIFLKNEEKKMNNFNNDSKINYSSNNSFNVSYFLEKLKINQKKTD